MRIRQLLELLELRDDEDVFELRGLPEKIKYRGDI